MKIFKTKITSSLLIISIIGGISSCYVAPVTSHFESARTLKKKNIEASANFTHYDKVYSDQSIAGENNNFGF